MADLSRADAQPVLLALPPAPWRTRVSLSAQSMRVVPDSFCLRKQDKCSLEAKFAFLKGHLPLEYQKGLKNWTDTGIWASKQEDVDAPSAQFVGMAIIKTRPKPLASRRVLQTEEHHIVWHSWNSPQPHQTVPPLLFFDIVDAVLFDAVVDATPFAETHRAPTLRACWLVEANLLFQSDFAKSNVLHFGNDPADPTRKPRYAPLNEIFAEWQRQYRLPDLWPTVCFASCAPCAVLAACRLWNVLSEVPRSSEGELASYRRQHKNEDFRALFAWPNLACNLAQRRRSECVQPASSDGEVCKNLKLNLAQWGSRMLELLDAAPNHVQEEVRDQMETQLEMMLHHADSVHSVMAADDPVEYPKARQQMYRASNASEGQGMSSRGVHKLSSRVLVHAVAACLHLRDSADLAHEALGLVRLLLPELADAITSRIHQLPSVSTISKGRAAVDVGFMLWMREVTANTSQKEGNSFLIRTLLTDSSPQKKFDWLLTEYHTFSGNNVVEVLKLVWQLAKNRGSEEPVVAAERKALQGKLEILLEKKTSHDVWAPQCFDQHICPPVAIGSRRASLTHKVHALLHSLLLEVSLFSGLRKFLQTVRSVTTDFGIESGMAEARNVQLKHLFHYMVDVDFTRAPDPAESPDHAASQDSLVFLFEHALQVPGALHILHGATKEITDGFEHFESFFLPLLRATCNSLSKPSVQDRFVHHCLLGAPAERFGKNVKEFNASLAHWRWGTLVQACQSLSELETALLFWDLSKVQSGESQAPEPGFNREDAEAAESAAADLEKVQEAVFDKAFWAYLHMVILAAKVLDHLEHWVEGCCCHYKSKDFDSKNVYFRTRSTCVMAGRRGPELAAGALDAIVTEHFNSAKSRLLLKVALLTEESADMILHDFSSSAARVSLYLTTKFACWKTPPHKLVVVGHHDEAVARRGIAECLAWWDSTVQNEEDRQLHHRLSQMYFNNGPLRQELQRFVDGAQRESLPLVMLESVAMSLVMLTERSIEGKHALAGSKTKVMKRLRPAAFSLSLRAAEMQQKCFSSVDCLNHFVGKVALARSEPNLLVVTGLSAHPVAQTLQSEGHFVEAGGYCEDNLSL